jgi:hypothetical protein
MRTLYPFAHVLPQGLVALIAGNSTVIYSYQNSTLVQLSNLTVADLPLSVTYPKASRSLCSCTWLSIRIEMASFP